MFYAQTAPQILGILKAFDCQSSGDVAIKINNGGRRWSLSNFSTNYTAVMCSNRTGTITGWTSSNKIYTGASASGTALATLPTSVQNNAWRLDNGSSISTTTVWTQDTIYLNMAAPSSTVSTCDIIIVGYLY